ncbi:MAG: flagellar biosynthesis protein FlhF [Desulfuromonadaceae bacterium]|nr:flagellar biosynthesis protein FlhF [Desulfuromonadaceae bacterium]
MQVKVFESEDMSSALRMIKEELGPDALILSSRTVRKGGMGLFGKPVLEVTAAIDADAEMDISQQHSSALPGGSALDAAPFAPQNSKAFSEHIESAEAELTYAQLWRRQPVISSAADIAPHSQPAHEYTPAQPYSQAVSPQASNDHYDVAQLRAELGSLRKMVGDLVEDLPQRLEQLARPRISVPPAHSFNPKVGYKAAAELGPEGEVLQRLQDYGIEPETAQTIAHFVTGQLTAAQIADKEQLRTFLHATIADLVQTHGPIFPQQEGEQRRIALIGPTGVGKTTTIAKLAAAYLLAGGKRVALITIDTYRIAAVEQLKVYGEIMNLPVEVVVRPEHLQQVLERHQNKDLVLIDTAGRSPRDSVSLDDLEAFLAVDPRIEAHLVLSATTRDRDLYETYKRFSVLEPRSLLLTKLDECESAGVLLNIHVRHNCPLSYVTNGQKVPEDIVLLTPEHVGDLVLGSSEG